MASGSANGAIHLWDLPSRRQLRTLAEHEGSVTSLAFHPSGDALASGSEDDTVRVWNLSTGRSKILNGHGNAVTSVAFHPKGTLLASGSRDHTVLFWDAEKGELAPPTVERWRR